MSIDILYFASTREALGLDAESIDLSAASTTVGELLETLRARGPVWAEALCEGRILHAVNHEMVSASSLVVDGDEVAFFPPVTGG